jgi:hypothetical protein
MTYETVIPELFERFPELRSIYESEFRYMGDEQPLANIVFGSVLIPYLEAALEASDLRKILTICAFLEDVAHAAKADISLETLLRTEIGAWLGGMAHEERLTPWLGTETKQICGYVPGLATQRLRLKADEEGSRLGWFSSTFKRIFSR